MVTLGMFAKLAACLPKLEGMIWAMNTKPSLERLGGAVAAMREHLHLTQDQVAARGGPSDVTVRGIENGTGRPPNSATLRKLDRVLGWDAGIAEGIYRGEVVFQWVDDVDEDGTWLQHDPMTISEQNGRTVHTVYSRTARTEQNQDVSLDAESDSELGAEELEASELAALLVTRSQGLERRVRELEGEVRRLRASLAESTAPENTAKRPLPDDVWGLAAHEDVRQREQMDPPGLHNARETERPDR